MVNSLKKSGQKIAKRLTRFSKKASLEGKEHIKENLVGRISHVRDARLLILEWSLLVFAIIMLAVTQAIWHTNSYSSDAFVAGGFYTEATLGKVSSLNPLFASTNSEKALSKLLFATLTTSDYSGHTGPGLAESVTADESGKIWTIRLRENLKWSDGESLTADDVVFTVALIQNPKVSSSFSSNVSGVNAAKVDDHTITFTLPSAYVNFSSALSIPILPKHILSEVDPSLLLEHSFNSAPVSSGAYKYNATQIVSSAGETVIYLVPNQYYYKGMPLISSFAIHAFTATSDILSAIKSGTVTATAELAATDAKEATSSKIYERQTSISSGAFAFFNTANGVFSDKALRQTVQKGLDISTIREVVGDELPLDYPIISTQAKLNNWPALPEHSEQSVAVETPVNLATISTGYFPAIADKFAEQLRNMGFNVEVTVYDPGQDFAVNVISARNYDILIYEVELGPDPDLFAYYHSSQASTAGLNLSNYKNSLADDAILAARSTMKVDLRISKYETFLRQWVADVPAIGIYQVNMTYYYNRNVRTFSEDNCLVYATDRFTDVEDWAAVKAAKNRTP